MADLEAARETVARSCRILGKLNLTKESAGHVSARIEGTDRILIRRGVLARSGSGSPRRATSSTVDLAGRKIEGREDLVPPREVFLHTWMYKTVSTVSSVVHVHPPTVVLFTICNKPLLPLFGAYGPSSLRLLLDGIATYPRSVTVSNDQLGEEFAA